MPCSVSLYLISRAKKLMATANNLDCCVFPLFIRSCVFPSAIFYLIFFFIITFHIFNNKNVCSKPHLSRVSGGVFRNYYYYFFKKKKQKTKQIIIKLNVRPLADIIRCHRNFSFHIFYLFFFIARQATRPTLSWWKKVALTNDYYFIKCSLYVLSFSYEML